MPPKLAFSATELEDEIAASAATLVEAVRPKSPQFTDSDEPAKPPRKRRPRTPAERRLQDVRANLKRAERGIQAVQAEIRELSDQAAGKRTWNPFVDRTDEPRVALRQARRRLAGLQARQARWAAAVQAAETAVRSQRGRDKASTPPKR